MKQCDVFRFSLVGSSQLHNLKVGGLIHIPVKFIHKKIHWNTGLFTNIYQKCLSRFGWMDGCSNCKVCICIWKIIKLGSARDYWPYLRLYNHGDLKVQVFQCSRDKFKVLTFFVSIMWYIAALELHYFHFAQSCSRDYKALFCYNKHLSIIFWFFR